jgi:hypothetical protein
VSEWWADQGRGGQDRTGQDKTQPNPITQDPRPKTRPKLDAEREKRKLTGPASFSSRACCILFFGLLYPSMLPHRDAFTASPVGRKGCNEGSNVSK